MLGRGVPRRSGEALETISTTAVAPPPAEELFAHVLRELGLQARAFRFEVAPNPCVGAAVLSGDHVIARGFHEVWGAEHAEIRALAAARATGTTPSRWDALLVTLEPCSSSGKTPPCVEAVLASVAAREVSDKKMHYFFLHLAMRTFDSLAGTGISRSRPR